MNKIITHEIFRNWRLDYPDDTQYSGIRAVAEAPDGRRFAALIPAGDDALLDDADFIALTLKHIEDMSEDEITDPYCN